MSSSAEARLIRRAAAAFNDGDVERYLSGFAPQSLRWVSGLGVALTVSDIRANLMQLRSAFVALHLNEDLLFGADGHVCARWTLTGIHAGEYGGIAPTRREIAVQTCEVYTFAGDLVTESYVYGETMSLSTSCRESAGE